MNKVIKSINELLAKTEAHPLTFNYRELYSIFGITTESQNIDCLDVHIKAIEDYRREELLKSIKTIFSSTNVLHPLVKLLTGGERNVITIDSSGILERRPLQGDVDYLVSNLRIKDGFWVCGTPEALSGITLPENGGKLELETENVVYVLPADFGYFNHDTRARMYGDTLILSTHNSVKINNLNVGKIVLAD